MHIWSKIFMYSLIFLILTSEIAISISLPLWLDSVDSCNFWNVSNIEKPNEGSAAYTVVLISNSVQCLFRLIICLIFGNFNLFKINKWLIVLSSVSAVHSLITPYVSSSSRNLPTLQAVLLNCHLPFTIILRFVWFKKAPSKKKLICLIFI
ncbi:hypothetical protein HZS_4572 [Henneguya salminicola]|nr:hypothetical protein HZS_4572 [Henneguya salminicola]